MIQIILIYFVFFNSNFKLEDSFITQIYKLDTISYNIIISRSVEKDLLLNDSLLLMINTGYLLKHNRESLLKILNNYKLEDNNIKHKLIFIGKYDSGHNKNKLIHYVSSFFTNKIKYTFVYIKDDNNWHLESLEIKEIKK